jgi:hypothetical protein
VQQNIEENCGIWPSLSVEMIKSGITLAVWMEWSSNFASSQREAKDTWLLSGVSAFSVIVDQ